jgi:hypothetical protein
MLAVLAAGSAVAAAQADETRTTVSSAGQKAAVDPQTKKLRPPTPEESQALDRGAAAPSIESVKTTRLPDGSVMAQLPEDFMDTSVVEVGPDGALTVSCVKGAAAAEALVKGGAAADPVGDKPTKRAVKDAKKPALEER